MDKHPFNVFSRYVEGNKFVLTGLGIIATLTALFLNLDQATFGDSLRNLQLLFLLFLVLGLIFLTINSLLWFKNNADSLFAGIIAFSLGLTAWNVWEFVLANFRDELNKYLLLIFISVAFMVYSSFNNLKKKAESEISIKISGALSKAVLYGLVTFLSLYLPNVFLGFYSDFAQNRVLSAAQFIESLSKTYIWLLAIWVAVAEFCGSFFFTKDRSRLWLNIFLLLILGISLIAILWPIVLDLICVFKKC